MCRRRSAEDVVYLAMILHDHNFFDTVLSNLLLRYMIHTKLSFIVVIRVIVRDQLYSTIFSIELQE